MKTLILTFLILASNAFAGEILGIPTGVYEGKGTIVSKTMFVPNLDFISLRTLNTDGTVTVTSSAYLVGEIPVIAPPVIILPMGFPFSLKLFTLTGHLKFVRLSPQRVEIYNLDELVAGKPTHAGSAKCDDRSCTFTATINKGSFTLTETWVRDGDGFRLDNGSQTMTIKGFKAHGVYSAEFAPKH